MVKEMKNKRAQVTTFVIIGIVILVLVVGGVLLVSNYKKNRINVHSSGETEFQEVKEKLDFMFRTCVEDIVKYEAKSAIPKGGYIGDEFPSNSLDYNGELLAVSFDRSDPFVMFKTKSEMSALLQERLLERIPECFDDADKDPVLGMYEVDVYVYSLYVKASDDSFEVSYDYEMQVDDVNETHTMVQMIEVPIFRILSEANSITGEFLETYDAPDLLYNQQACNSFYDKYKIKPEYPVDILKIAAGNENVTGIIVQKDFFIVNMDVEGEEFSFAIKPVLVGSIC